MPFFSTFYTFLFTNAEESTSVKLIVLSVMNVDHWSLFERVELMFAAPRMVPGTWIGRQYLAPSRGMQSFSGVVLPQKHVLIWEAMAVMWHHCNEGVHNWVNVDAYRVFASVINSYVFSLHAIKWARKQITPLQRLSLEPRGNLGIFADHSLWSVWGGF